MSLKFLLAVTPTHTSSATRMSLRKKLIHFWKKRTAADRPLSWLIDHFKPVPGWE